jgi:hypothetical protein
MLDRDFGALAEPGFEDQYDPDPLTLVLEIANLVFQPGSLAALAAGVSAATSVLMWREVKEKQITEIRRKLYEIDRALTDGFGAVMLLASLLDQFNHLGHPVGVGRAAITGFKNSQRLRKAHEDCRGAVKDARDAFLELSAILPRDTEKEVGETLRELNHLLPRVLGVEHPYGRFLVAATQALSVVDTLICKIGERCDFKRSPRVFTDELIQSLPGLASYRER